LITSTSKGRKTAEKLSSARAGPTHVTAPSTQKNPFRAGLIKEAGHSKGRSIHCWPYMALPLVGGATQARPQ